MEDIPLEELNSLLANFYIKVRIRSGEEFEPGTLTSFQLSFDNYQFARFSAPIPLRFAYYLQAFPANN